MYHDRMDEAFAELAVNDDNRCSECRGQAATASFEITAIASTWVD